MVSVSKDGEVTVKGKKAISPIPTNQISPAVAFNGENYFIVWQDFRSGKFWIFMGQGLTLPETYLMRIRMESQLARL